MLKAVIIEDEPHLLQMLAYFLTLDARYDVIATFSQPLEALENITALAPDVVFVDIEMPTMNGIELASRIKHDGMQIVFTTAYTQYALEALKLEASDYLLKPITPESIADMTPKLLKKQAMIQHFLTTIESSVPSIQCFGSFSSLNAQQEVVKWPTRKVEELFAYLLVHRHNIVNKWRLADDLWPAKGINNIYNSVYLLNKTLKQYNMPIRVSNMNEGYVLDIETTVSVDLFQLQQLTPDRLGEDKAIELLTTLSTCGGLFNDKDYTWALLYREQFQRKHQELLQHALRHYEYRQPRLFESLLKQYDRLYT